MEPETEAEPDPEDKTCFTAAEATNFRDCCFRDRDGDVWLFDEETQRWRFILFDGTLSDTFQNEPLSSDLEPFILVEGEVEPETEAEPEPEDKTQFSGEEASAHKNTVFKDRDGDTWFFNYGLWLWRAIGPGWAHEWEELDGLYGPYTKVGPLSEHKRLWTAEEANDLKDEALVDSDWDTWIYDVPSEQWKCYHPGGSFSQERLDDSYQPYRIKRAESGTAPTVSYDEPSPDPEEVTFEGSAKEAVELLDRIARSLESISRKLGDEQ